MSEQIRLVLMTFAPTSIRFIEFGLEKLVYFAKAHGESGKAELNATTYTHRIVITADDTGNVKYSGCDLKAGTLRILFNENHYGYWQDNALSCLDEALDLASQASSQFSFLPRSTIKQHYDPEIGAVQSKIAGMLKLDDLVLNPYSEDNAKKLAKEPPYSEWRREYGTTLLHVFQQAAAGLEEAKFGEDDMLREALVEALEKKEIGIRVVDKLTKSSKNEVVIEKGVLYLQVSFKLSDILAAEKD